MKSRLLPLFLTLLFVFILSACSVDPISDKSSEAQGTTSSLSETKKDASKNTELPKENKVYSVLFIGNSYTHTNSMPTEYFQKIAQAEGYQVEITSIAQGAYRLYKYADPTDTYGKK